MKNLFLILFYTLLFSCTVQNRNTVVDVQMNPISSMSKVTEIEDNIINAFIDVELKKDRYKNYKDAEIFVIEEALKKHKSLETYIFSKNEWNAMHKIHRGEDRTEIYFLDTLQINKLELELEKEEVYHWKTSDFKNLNVSLLKYEDLVTIIKTAAYSNFSIRLIIYLSKPLIIDENNAFVSFEVGAGQLGFHSINHFTVLMRKVDNKWEQINLYYDGVYN
ncbi:hypothetical protein ACFX5E_16120 [Flavobacterium sp. LS2P90]|uniref:Lipoprotein n=1 Tax=Flavobacterium xylosi TaxID=3230415 RepID=A0ABW6HZY6_9FLAO